MSSQNTVVIYYFDFILKRQKLRPSKNIEKIRKNLLKKNTEKFTEKNTEKFLGHERASACSWPLKMVFFVLSCRRRLAFPFFHIFQ